MKIIYGFSIALFMFAFVAFASAQFAAGQDITADSILGKWKDPDEDAVVQIENKGGYYEGALVEDAQHPDGVSTKIFKNLVYDSDKGMWKGQVYSVKKKKDYDVEIKMTDNASFTMKVKAGIVSKTIVWSRVQ
ncbi:MAG: DUF2147 domain-containing protein [Candidatus Dadabacteria bacterium]|nr:DUF2147 domain-containing protein [Candidatus Dadabacteria bacterium]